MIDHRRRLEDELASGRLDGYAEQRVREMLAEAIPWDPCAFQHPGWTSPCGQPRSASVHATHSVAVYSGRIRHDYWRAIRD